MVTTQVKYCPRCFAVIWAFYLACPRCGTAFVDLSLLLKGVRWIARLVRGKTGFKY